MSGGADSLCLALTAGAWARRHDIPFTALTVDHGLRPESAGEARQVARWLAAAGIAHQVLRWRGDKPSSDIQAAARDARYRLMTGWCRRHKVGHLLLAHHRDDQAETFLIRAGRGSGVDGLAAMPPARRQDGVLLLRPLLDQPKARLETTLRAIGQDWIEDPSNRNPAFTRTKVRAALNLLAPDGLAAARFAATARHMQRVRALLDQLTGSFAARFVDFSPHGFAAVAADPIARAPDELALRVWRLMLSHVVPAAPPPRFDALSGLHAAFAAGAADRRTLSGCLIARAGDRLVVAREPHRLPAPVALTQRRSTVWDDRFAATANRPGLSLGALGPGQRRWLEKLKLSNGLPAAARPGLPAIRSRGQIVALPTLGWRDDSVAAVVIRFHAFGAKPVVSDEFGLI